VPRDLTRFSRVELIPPEYAPRSEDHLPRLGREIYEAASGTRPRADVVEHIERVLQLTDGPCGTDALFHNISGRKPAIEIQKGIAADLFKAGVLAPNPNGRGWVVADMNPSWATRRNQSPSSGWGSAKPTSRSKVSTTGMSLRGFGSSFELLRQDGLHASPSTAGSGIDRVLASPTGTRPPLGEPTARIDCGDVRSTLGCERAEGARSSAE